jgi:hypothetical protein
VLAYYAGTKLNTIIVTCMELINGIGAYADEVSISALRTVLFPLQR